MSVVPTWQAPTAGYPANAGSVNQLLGTHAVTYVYQGTEQASAAHGSGTVASDSLWLGQPFTTASSQTAVGWVALWLGATNAPPPLTISLQASASGAPSGTPLASSAVPAEFLSTSPASTPVMLPVTGLASSVEYWIVAEAAGDTVNYFTWGKSTGSGAQTSADGVTWTAQSYGLAYAVYDQTATAPVAGTWEDSGARWTAFAYNGSSQLVSVREFTAGQSPDGYTAASRTVTYSGSLVTKVA